MIQGAERGEAVGAYRSMDQPILVSVSGNQTDLDFNVACDVGLPAQIDTSAAGGTTGRAFIHRQALK